MKPALMSFFVLMSLPLSVYSMPTTEVTEAVKMPDLIALYHLEDFESEGPALEKRRNVRVCERILAITSHCVVIGKALKDGILQISSAIKHASNVETCTTFTGRAGPGGNLFYRYHGTFQSNGRHCDTTAEQETIAGAIERHIKRQG
ncbi:amino acid transporter AAT family [Fusarium globosum]|uniref:Amino acid transporter AAT family n=1 Tax=Fusarium globosum TaxID=78864 RepID=A0A8H5Y9C8_9HYPO|nr:amino acid transporter AAT family [Fusarium globosum]